MLSDPPETAPAEVAPPEETPIEDIAGAVALATAPQTPDPKQTFADLTHNAVSVYKEVLDPLSNTPQRLRLQAADRVLDREWGRPKNMEESTGNTILEILRTLKSLTAQGIDPSNQSRPAIDVTPGPQEKPTLSTLMESWESENIEPDVKETEKSD